MSQMTQYLDSLIAGSTPQRPMWNIERWDEDRPPAWNYIDGCMLKAIWDMHDATGEQHYFDFLRSYVNFFVDEHGSILGYSAADQNCDQINEGKILFPLSERTGDGRYVLAIERLMEQLRSQPRTPEGNFWHKRIYPNQIWLDGLYMVQPFRMAYEMKMGGARDYQDIVRQFETVARILRDPQTGLYYHGYDASRAAFWCNKRTGLSQNFWGRSIGWFAMALIDTIELVDERYFDEKMRLEAIFKDLCGAVEAVLDPETSLLYQLPALPGLEGNYLETSASCAMAYCYMKGVRLGALPERKFAVGERMLGSVVEHKLTEVDGKLALKDICLVAGLGGMPGRGEYKLRDGSAAYYLSEPRVQNDAKGVAPLLFAEAERLRAIDNRGGMSV